LPDTTRALVTCLHGTLPVVGSPPANYSGDWRQWGRWRERPSYGILGVRRRHRRGASSEYGS
jgi:hypothetical protein